MPIITDLQTTAKNKLTSLLCTFKAAVTLIARTCYNLTPPLEIWGSLTDSWNKSIDYLLQDWAYVDRVTMVRYLLLVVVLDLDLLYYSLRMDHSFKNISIMLILWHSFTRQFGSHLVICIAFSQVVRQISIPFSPTQPQYFIGHSVVFNEGPLRVSSMLTYIL